MKEISEMENDGWELIVIRQHKQDPFKYPLNEIKCKSYLEEILCDCEIGMAIGENWHGEMTREEWKTRKEYIEKVLGELLYLPNQIE
jgi:hypothetical protein